jgi:hypothetical protein
MILCQDFLNKPALNLYVAAYFSDDVCCRAGDDAIDLVIKRSEILGVEFQLRPRAKPTNNKQPLNAVAR